MEELYLERLALVLGECISTIGYAEAGAFRGEAVLDEQPDWLSEHEKSADPEVVVVVHNGVYGLPKLPVVYREHSRYTVSGEAECYCDSEEEEEEEEKCELCEGEGLVYIGEGWTQRILEPLRITTAGGALDAYEWDALNTACDGTEAAAILNEAVACSVEDEGEWKVSIPALAEAFIATGRSGDLGVILGANHGEGLALWRVLTEGAGIDPDSLMAAAVAYGASSGEASPGNFLRLLENGRGEK